MSESRRTIHVIPGIHNHSAETSAPGQLLPLLEECGYHVELHDYGYALAIFSRFRNPGRARDIAKKIRPGDIIIGHSNGACLAWMIANLGAPVGGLVLLNAALDRDAVIPEHVPWVHVYHNDRDVPVMLARIFLNHDYGSMGRHGHILGDRRVTNIDTGLLYGCYGHSDLYRSPRMQRAIITRLTQQMSLNELNRDHGFKTTD